MSALTAPRKCPHTQLRLTLTAEEIGAHAKALVASLEDAWKAIEKGEGDALAAWTEATDAVAVAARGPRGRIQSEPGRGAAAATARTRAKSWFAAAVATGISIDSTPQRCRIDSASNAGAIVAAF